MHVLFTHNDLDGAACGILARCAFGAKVDVRYNSVSSLDARLERFLERTGGRAKKGQKLFITDLSVGEANEAALTRYAGGGGSVRLLDHHKTSLHLNRHAWACVQVEYDDGRLASAASLLYDYLLQHRWLPPRPAIAEFVELVRQYDTWEWERHDNVRAKRLNDLFFLLDLDEFTDRLADRLMKEEAFAFTEFENRILDLEEEKIERYIRRKKRELTQTFVEERCVGIVYAEQYHSELSHALGREFPHLDYIAILNPGGKKLSLRTIHDGIDVSEVAGRFGGGGHAKAAGCPLTGEAFRLFAVEPYALEPLRGDAPRTEYNVRASPYGVLFGSRQEDELFLFGSEGRWYVDLNGETVGGAFDSFEDAERYAKREHGAWLLHDDAYIRYLMAHSPREYGSAKREE